jgi:hypothetical protein
MTRFAEAVEHVCSRLWHCPVQRALELIGDIVAALDAVAAVASPRGGAAGKVAKLLHGLETYVTGRSEPIIDYAAKRHDGGASIDGTDRKHGAMAASSPDGCASQMRRSLRGAR